MGEHNNIGITTGLEFKEHRQFFDDYFKYKRVCTQLYAEASENPSKLSVLMTSINTLRVYTSNYISNNQQIKQKINVLRNRITNNGLRLSPKEYQDILDDIDTLLTEINEAHENSELLPKKQKEEKLSQDIWRYENSLIMREVKKGMADIIIGN